jgi:hypothetical protein
MTDENITACINQENLIVNKKHKSSYDLSILGKKIMSMVRK